MFKQESIFSSEVNFTQALESAQLQNTQLAEKLKNYEQQITWLTEQLNGDNATVVMRPMRPG